MPKPVTWRRVPISTWILLVALALLVGGLLLSVPWPMVTARGKQVFTAWGPAGLVAILGALLLLAVLVPRTVMRARHRNRAAGRRVSVKPIPMWAIWLGLIVVVLVGGVTAWALVTTFGSASPQDKIQLEAIKLAGTIAVGTGGGAALLLTARRQRVTELDLLQKGHDADERRVTELYTAAAQQLASDKAPVRLAGLYALERLGQTNPEHQQTLVNLFCAYLRMPDASAPVKSSAVVGGQRNEGSEQDQQNDAREPLLLDLAPTLAEAAGLFLDATDQQQQERQVRLTAQRLLAQHMRPDPDEDGQPANSNFWGGPDGEGMDIDLANATLHDWDFSNCHVRRANFDGAHFCGFTKFLGAQFHDDASFHRVTFHGAAWFKAAQFHEEARLSGANFFGLTQFSGAYFHGWTSFEEVSFHDAVYFEGVHFHGRALLMLVWFHRHASFAWAEFHDDAWIIRLEFNEGAWLVGMQFHGGVTFPDVYIRLDTPGKMLAPEGWDFRPVDLGDGRKWAELSLEDV